MTQNTRSDVEFSSHGTVCRAWLYTPAAPNGAAIIMAHGLGGTRDAGLEPFALEFANNGFTVVLFDYRHFGASDGEPRQLLSISRQLQDWRAAVSYTRSLPGVDAARIGLWGTSFSGGHVLTTAANDSSIAAASAQGPMVDGLAASLEMVNYAGVGRLARLAAYGSVDQLRGLLGLQPITVPLVAAPGEFAAMSSHDALSGYGAITPSGWRNEMSARLALYLATYRPITKARKLRCPILIQACTKDSVAPAAAAVKLARKAGPNVELKEYDIGHFDIYVGKDRERAVADQLSFFKRALAAA